MLVNRDQIEIADITFDEMGHFEKIVVQRAMKAVGRDIEDIKFQGIYAKGDNYRSIGICEKGSVEFGEDFVSVRAPRSDKSGLIVIPTKGSNGKIVFGGTINNLGRLYFHPTATINVSDLFIDNYSTLTWQGGDVKNVAIFSSLVQGKGSGVMLDSRIEGLAMCTLGVDSALINTQLTLEVLKGVKILDITHFMTIKDNKFEVKGGANGNVRCATCPMSDGRIVIK